MKPLICFGFGVQKVLPFYSSSLCSFSRSFKEKKTKQIPRFSEKEDALKFGKGTQAQKLQFSDTVSGVAGPRLFHGTVPDTSRE